MSAPKKTRPGPRPAPKGEPQAARGAGAAGAGLEHDSTHLDWITVTHSDRAALWELLRPPVAARKCGLGYYRESWEDGYGALFAEGGPDERPFMLRMTGKALEAWRADHTDRDLVYHLAFNGAHCTRLDLARDTSGPWTPQRLWSYVTARRRVSKWLDFKAEHDADGHVLVVRCGSRSSDAFLRVYDKRREIESRGEACPSARLTRWEFEIKGDLAPVAFEQLARALPTIDPATGAESWRMRSLHAAWLSDRLRLTTLPVDHANKNQGKAEIDPAWAAFVATESDSVLAPELDTRDVEHQAQDFGGWLVRQISGALACAEAVGGPEILADLARLGRDRMSAKHRMFVDRIEDARCGLWRAVPPVSPAKEATT